MISKLAIKSIAYCALFAWSGSVFAHINLAENAAPAGSTYKAALQIGHGCEGSATTAVTVQVPEGFRGAQPIPKAGWTIALQRAKLAKPYDNHGKAVTEDVSVVSWTANSKEAALQAAYFDEFMLRGSLPKEAGPLWFKVLQTCEKGSANWNEVPASGTSAKGLKWPAALLNVTAMPVAAAHAPSAPGAAAGHAEHADHADHAAHQN